MHILQALIERGEVTVTEMAGELSVAPSTAHRILVTMTEHGAASRTPSRRYGPGPLLARPTRSPNALAATGRAFIDGVEGRQALRIGLRIGARIPAYCTSGGKAILAAMSVEQVVRLHPNGLPPWPGQRAHSMDELFAELDQVRRSGVAVNVGESEPGVVAIGVALPSSPLPTALAIALPADRFERTGLAELERALHEGIRRLPPEDAESASEM
ncbi:hypothetical protein LUZ63_023097 [Rhynchospora breviuscula]|uniref:IclR family transcriptional regulator n=1 Tax=Rhynchospora breviuscula TaxID=2022672 RepID=A0A9P9Z3I0_9POAL|nr:hypothetical protein LUZ63_023097 [Rhynchospora breviuscula]